MFSTYKHLFLKLNTLKYKFSFGLVETAVAVGIIGTMAGISLSAYNASNPQYKRDVEKINKIQDALQKFFSTNFRHFYIFYNFTIPSRGQTVDNHLR